MYWLIGGTKDARDFLNKVNKKKIIVSVATEYGAELLKEFDCKVVAKRLNLEDMITFVKAHQIKKIIDLTHPYAVEVSKNAIETSKKLDIPYYRYERKNLLYEGVKEFSELSHMVREVELNIEDRKILSTLGSNNIDKFKYLSKKENFFARILPMVEALEKCKKAKLLSKNIMAMQGPFSKEFNICILKNYKINILLMKESGKSGGEHEKIEACRELGIEVFLLKKPKIEYPIVFNQLDKMIDEIL